MRRMALAVCAVVVAAAMWIPVAGEAAQPQELHDRTYADGAVLLRFHREHMHFALVLDAVPVRIEERSVTLSDGRLIAFRWSGRSIWIEDRKYDLPFGTVFLVSTDDSVRVRQLEFKAVRSRVVLDQVGMSADVAAWLEAHADSAGPTTRQDIEASTMPRYTLELAQWKYRGAHALTCILSGEPQFVVVADVPVSVSGTGATTFGGFDFVNVWIGTGDDAQMWKSKEGAATVGDRSFDYRNGRVFLSSSDGAIQQLNVPLTLGAVAAAALTDQIEALPQVRAHLGLE